MLRRRISARRTRSACAALVVLSAVASGCTSAPPDLTDPANRAQGSGTIVWMSSPTLSNASDDLRQVLVDAFEQAYPTIKVDLQPGPDNTNRMRDKLLGELSAGSPTPDVYSGDVIWPAEFGHDGLALPLNKYLPDSFWARFAPPGTPLADNTLIQAMSYQGNIYAVPYFVDYGLLFYRKDLLKQAGLSAPTTWQQLIADANVLRGRNLAYQFAWQGDQYEGLTCDWIELLADAYGSAPRTDAGAATDQATAARLASPQALQALDFLRTLIDDGLSPAGVNGFEEPQGDKAFDSGQVAFLRGWDSSYANAMSVTSRIADTGKVGVVPLPTFQGPGPGPGFSVIGGWNLFVNPRSRNLGADLTFVRWMTGPQAQRIVATQFSEIPSNYAVRTSPSVTAGNPVMAAAALTRPVSRPAATPDYDQLSQDIYSNVHDALPSGPGEPAADPCSALLAAARQIDPAVHGTLSCPPSSSPGGGP